MADKILSQTMQRSCCSLWCWAAVTSAITQLHGPALSQSEIFRVMYADIDCSSCCANKCSDLGCNRRADIGTILTQLGLNAGGPTDLGQVTYSDVCSQIDLGRPVVGVIQYVDFSGMHYLLIIGYAGEDTITIGDPADGQIFTASFRSYLDPGAYIDPSTGQAHGSWIEVYYLDAI